MGFFIARASGGTTHALSCAASTAPTTSAKPTHATRRITLSCAHRVGSDINRRHLTARFRERHDARPRVTAVGRDSAPVVLGVSVLVNLCYNLRSLHHPVFPKSSSAVRRPTIGRAALQ